VENAVRSSSSVASDPIEREGPVASRIVLGFHLRRLREARGITRDAAGHAIRASGAKISRLELGRVGVKERDVVDLLTLYGFTEVAQHSPYLDLARQGNRPGWWQPYGPLVPGWFETYIGLEQAASLIRSYDLQFVPGLLQTADYAREVVRLQHDDCAEVDRRVELRLRRQQVLESATPPVLWCVIDESALRRPLAGPELCRAQLKHLITQVERPNIQVQIAPLSHGGHAAAGGSFSLLRFANPDLPDVVYLEQLTTAIYLDKRADVERYAIVMDRLCAEIEPVGRTSDLLKRIRDEL
jgi:Domain of unknown function (DUF5753)/Helix-turn-helix domain